MPVVPFIREQFAVFKQLIAKFFERNAEHMDEFEEAAAGENDAGLFFELASFNIDLINIFLVAVGVRNGTQLEIESVENIMPEPMLADFLQMLNSFPNMRARNFGGRAIIVWNPTRVTDAELANSWATAGNAGHSNNNVYFANTAKLLGTPYGYPTYTRNPRTGGSWNIRVSISMWSNEENGGEPTTEMNSLCGGAFDVTIPNDLAGAAFIYENAKMLEGETMPYPFLNVQISGIEFDRRGPRGVRGGGERRRARCTRRHHRASKKSRRQTKK